LKPFQPSRTMPNLPARSAQAQSRSQQVTPGASQDSKPQDPFGK